MLRWLLPRVVATVAVLVGLIVGLGGGSKVVEHRWVIVSGTVGACWAGGSPDARECSVSWDSVDGPRSATVVVRATEATAGRPVVLRVDGDEAVANGGLGSIWLDGGVTLLGLAVVAGGLVLLFRSPHRPYKRSRSCTGISQLSHE